MSQKNETTILILSLLFTAGIVGAVYWFFTQQNSTKIGNFPLSAPSEPSQVTAFAPPSSVTPGTTVRIDGSTSMVGINQSLKLGFESKFRNTMVLTNAKGSGKGLELLLAGKVDLAAVSRPLTAAEQKAGLVAIPITKDAIAIIIGQKNPFRQSLTQKQLFDIFTGVINNWSAVGGLNTPMKVYNRPIESGTRTAFRELVLTGSNFGTTSNIKNMARDATTPIIQLLGTDGISYATYAQASRQKTAHVVPIDGIKPGDNNYPLVRFLYYAYKNPASEPVKAFLGYATSVEGQAALSVGSN